ncbi:hypothetical protein C5S29_10815 [ANME-1 cluster archaeon GoMg3.2]|nr:hypothetical protein [ANME-1 cluster archaeon GoMg3.2]
MKKRIKYFYFFGGSLASPAAYVHFYKGWVDIARKNGLPMELITILPFKTYITQRRLVKKYRQISYFRIFCGIHNNFDHLLIFVYFFYIGLLNDKIIIHLNKRPPYLFDIFKKIFPKKLKYIIELEGDYESEMDYLSKHPYKDGFYANEINRTEMVKRQLKKRIKSCDCLFVVTEKFKNLLIERHSDLNLEQKVKVLPISVDTEEVYFSMKARGEYRRRLKLEDKFVMIYVGNAYRSWQNVFRTIEILKLIKNKVAENAFLILLIRQEDHHIVKEFIEKLNLSKNEYILTQVDHEEIAKYLSASDIGILLRHKHLMNEVVTSGKIVEYLACGLPVLTTNVVAVYPEEISKNNYGIILNDMDDNNEILTKIIPFLKHDKEKRFEICEWARRKFSTDAHSQEYVNALIGLATEE